MIATPEKALADQVFQLCKGLNEKELLVDLIESKRIELSALKNLDKVLMLEIANKYHSKTIRTLANIIVKL